MLGAILRIVSTVLSNADCNRSRRTTGFSQPLSNTVLAGTGGESTCLVGTLANCTVDIIQLLKMYKSCMAITLGLSSSILVFSAVFFLLPGNVSSVMSSADCNSSWRITIKYVQPSQ